MVLAATLLVSCRPSDEQCARVLVDSAQQMVDAGRWQQARVFIDSVHNTYPQQVEQRRAAKVLADTITYLEAKRTLAYSDSLLNTLLPQADELMRLFRYEKNADYEDHGRYVHRLLATTGSNTSRNFLQAYVRDDKETIVKSYYYGAQRANQRAVTLSSEEVESRFEGTNHAAEFRQQPHLRAYPRERRRRKKRTIMGLLSLRQRKDCPFADLPIGIPDEGYQPIGTQYPHSKRTNRAQRAHNQQITLHIHCNIIVTLPHSYRTHNN